VVLTATNEGAVPPFVDTGPIPAWAYQLYGAEAALVLGPLSLQSEYIATTVNAIDGETLFFYGAYAYASYFLTGEHRQYEPKWGRFGRMKPFVDVVRFGGGRNVCFGCGAWEVAARWSYLDLNSDAVLGGRLVDFTAGVNWYLNAYARIMFNYIRADLDNPMHGRSNADVFAMRAQLEF
jgi:phosphate-selective porin OprO/OprP